MFPLGKIILAASLSLVPAIASADAIWIGQSATNPIMDGGVHVLRIEGNNLIFTGLTDAESSKPLNLIQQISVDGETDFNAAEQAYRDGKLAAAADGYQRAIRTSTKPWIQDRSSMRLAALSSKLGRFDTAVTAYVGLVLKDPNIAQAARPAITDADRASFDGAIADLKRALAITQISDAQRSDLLGLLLELYRAKNDTVNANQTVSEMIKLGIASPADVVRVKLAAAQTALDAKDYDTAISQIQRNRTLFNDSAQQAEAFFILARAKEATSGEKPNPDTLKDIAIAYMRAVTAGKEAPAQPRVADGLLHIAQIEEKLNEPQAAIQLYQQITRETADRQAVNQARAALERLTAKRN